MYFVMLDIVQSNSQQIALLVSLHPSHSLAPKCMNRWNWEETAIIWQHGILLFPFSSFLCHTDMTLGIGTTHSGMSMLRIPVSTRSLDWAISFGATARASDSTAPTSNCRSDNSEPISSTRTPPTLEKRSDDDNEDSRNGHRSQNSNGSNEQRDKYDVFGIFQYHWFLPTWVKQERKKGEGVEIGSKKYCKN